MTIELTDDESSLLVLAINEGLGSSTFSGPERTQLRDILRRLAQKGGDSDEFDSEAIDGLS